MSDVKVSRDGVVTRGGAIIGHVKKEMRKGLFGQLLGTDSEGSPWWIPFSDDGTRLSDGYDTRKKAVARIEKHARPMTADGFKLEYGLGSSTRCVTGWVTFRGFAFGVSRYADESVWVVDYYSTPDSIMPVFSNGTGTRATRAQVLKGEAAQAATDAATAAGMWPIPAE